MFPSLTGAPRRTVRHSGTPRARVLTGGLLAVLFLLVTALTAVLPATPARAAEPDWLNGVERFEPTEATVYLAHGVPNDPTQVSTGTQLTRQRQTSTTFEDLGLPSSWVYNALAFHPEQRVIYAVSQYNSSATSQARAEGGHLLVIGADGGVTDLGLLRGFRNSADRANINVGFLDVDGTYWIANTSATSAIFGVPSREFYRITGLDGTGPTMHQTSSTGTTKPSSQDYALADGHAWGAYATQRDGEPYLEFIERIDLATGQHTQWEVTSLNLFRPSSTVRQFGAAWTYGNGNLGLKRNDGRVFQLDVRNPADADPTFTLVSTYLGPASYSNDATSWTPAVAASVDLGLTKTGPAEVDPGGAITWTLEVANHSDVPSSGYTVTDTVPEGFTVSAPSSTGHACTVSGRTLSCAGRRWPPGSTGTSSSPGPLPRRRGRTPTPRPCSATRPTRTRATTPDR